MYESQYRQTYTDGTLTTVDRRIGLLIAGIILLGSYSWWRTTRRVLRRHGMMGEMMRTMPRMDPIWYLFGTLIAVRSAFSKVKVSQTVSELEDRGVIYRKKQGRTYRVDPGELLKERQQS